MMSSQTQLLEVLLPPRPRWPDTSVARAIPALWLLGCVSSRSRLSPEADRILQKPSQRMCIESCASVLPECHAIKSRVVSKATARASSMVRSDSARSVLNGNTIKRASSTHDACRG